MKFTMKKLGILLLAGLVVFDIYFVINWSMERQAEKAKYYFENMEEIDKMVMEEYSNGTN